MRTTRLGLFLLAALLAGPALAQVEETGGPPADEDGFGIRFNGLGRAYIQQTDLGGTLADTDTTTAPSLSDGEFVLDLALTAQPTRSVEVRGVLRLRNEFGGFFGSGVSVEVRELWARGIIAGVLEYRLGDMDLGLTPYTVHLPEADGIVNAPELFEPQLDRVYYEEFYTGEEERRFQGARLDFGLAFDQGIEATDVRAFFARLRPTDFTTTPTRYLGGGRIGATSARFGPYDSQARAGVNLSYIWDDLESGDANRGIRNAVVTGDLDVAVLDRDDLGVTLRSEAGRSLARFSANLEDPTQATARDSLRETDTFFEVGVEASLKQRGLTASATFVNVGPDFFSAAAQSKRVDYTNPLGLFNRLGNDRTRRTVGLFDLTRDPALYTFRVEDQLMTYDPRYNNTLPYGRATPNRRGLRLGLDYAPSGVLDSELLVAFLREIRGQGTTELKSFALVRAAADVAVAPLVGYGRDLGVTLGAQFESTSRDGVALEAVDLTSLLIEAGVAAEVYERLDVLLGLKTRTSSGREYVPQYENFNDVRDFPGPFVTDDSETLLGAGLRYRFREDIYLTVQYQHFSYGDDATPADDFDFGQVFALYSMAF